MLGFIHLNMLAQNRKYIRSWQAVCEQDKTFVLTVFHKISLSNTVGHVANHNT